MIRPVYEWRLTYMHSLTGMEDVSYGQDERRARNQLGLFGRNPKITDLRLWRRPKPEKWEPVDEYHP